MMCIDSVVFVTVTLSSQDDILNIRPRKCTPPATRENIRHAASEASAGSECLKWRPQIEIPRAGLPMGSDFVAGQRRSREGRPPTLHLLKKVRLIRPIRSMSPSAGQIFGIRGCPAGSCINPSLVAYSCTSQRLAAIGPRLNTGLLPAKTAWASPIAMPGSQGNNV